MKAAPEGVAMNDDLRAAEARHLWRLRKLTNWPLGESGFYARFDELTTLPALPDKEDEHRFQLLLKKLAELYAHSHSVFDEFRPPFDRAAAYRPKHPKNVLRLARLHFWQLVTTTRFEVADSYQKEEIIATEFNPCKPLERRHCVALAAMVFVKEALEILEDSGSVQEADASCRLAADWLAHLETESATNRGNKAERAKQARQAAAKPRKALTPQLVADYFNANPNKTTKARVLELADRGKVKERTVRTHLSKAKSLNLMQ